jgi:hypothetical protein
VVGPAAVRDLPGPGRCGRGQGALRLSDGDPSAAPRGAALGRLDWEKIINSQRLGQVITENRSDLL